MGGGNVARQQVTSRMSEPELKQELEDAAKV